MEMKQQIESAAIEKQFPDGTAYRSISVRDVRKIAAQFQTIGRFVEIAALEMKIIPERYVRNFRSYSFEEQIRLLKSRVTVVGLGGLGGGLSEILARSGVGRLNLIDGDRFEDSNLNRQWMSSEERIGESKSGAAGIRLRKVNSSVEIQTHVTLLTQENAENLIAESDLVADCLDNIRTRFILEAACKKMGIPLISAAIGGFSGQITTIYPEDRGLQTIFSAAEISSPKGAERTLGCPPQTVTVISSLESAEALKILTTGISGLRNRLLIVDLQDNSFHVFDLA